MTTKAKERWRPKNCHFRYTTYYKVPEPKAEEPKIISPPSEPHIVTEEEPPNLDRKWCSGCLSPAIEPMALPCGHNFCRSCIAHSRAYLIQEHYEQIRDRRSVLKCPVPACHATFLCYPIINGDVRFWKHHDRFGAVTKSL